MSDSDSGGSSSTRLSVFNGGVNDSYPHMRNQIDISLQTERIVFSYREGLGSKPHIVYGRRL
jgi:hypothetical protein